MPETPDDDMRWLVELQRRADELSSALGLGPHPAQDFIHSLLIPHVDPALSAYTKGETLVQMYTWQVGPSTANVVITADRDGVTVECEVPWLERELSSYYAPLGYTVEPLSHRDDTTLERSTRVRITRTA